SSTLDALIRAGSVRQAARMCGVHHSTLQTRVDTISDMVGFDPLDGLGRTRLGIAYLVWRLRHSRVLDLPAPLLRPGMVLVRTAASLVSAGTERTAVEFSKKSLLEKARSRPDLVKKVVEKARSDGVLTAWDAARSRLDEPLALGYSSAGTVIGVGEGVDGFHVGDRVACAGGGYASHAEIVCVPVNLVAPVPDGVALDHAAFSTVGAIGLHGLRLAEPQLGETVAVVGLGLIGLLAVQMAKASGLTVLGVDLDPSRVALARELGADVALVSGQGEDASAAARALTGGLGVDAALVTAATPSTAPVELAAELCRDRGRVVVVGAVGMDLPRPPFYEKELSFRVSRSYGPGRYDPTYEEGGVDYPIGYVRWTQNRNLGAFLEQVARGAVSVEPLVTHRFAIAEAASAYALITEGDEPSLGVLITYPQGPMPAEDRPARRVEMEGAVAPAGDVPGVALVGAGAFATATLLPAMKDAGGLGFVGVCTATGASAHHAAKKFGFRYATTEVEELLADPGVDVVAVATRHHLHAPQIVAALEEGKHVFCEKPPALDEDGLADVVRAHASAGDRLLAVGYNRRFAPMAVAMREALAGAGEPLMVHARVNAGFIPPDHWTQDPAVGGGRIIGEGCHFVDLLAFLTGSLPVRVSARGVADGGRYREDNVVLTLDFADGSVGSVTYVASGDRGLGKERVEAFGGGVAAALDDWRRLDVHRGGKRTGETSRLRQDKGHRGEWEALARALREGGRPPIALESLVATSLATFGAVRSHRSGEAEAIAAAGFIERARGGEGAGS
ncbi:MAG: zinc-binding dehydrogenase, partial [Gemmatimonadetes bacterium]|nr:zinc-binding dehydrogenase [Gemmatimonadota bacterium]